MDVLQQNLAVAQDFKPMTSSGDGRAAKPLQRMMPPMDGTSSTRFL